MNKKGHSLSLDVYIQGCW